MVFLKNWSGSLNLPTFANLVCSDSPDSPTFANLVSLDSPDSQKPSFASNKRIWRVWPIQQVQARSFFTYKICNLCLKRPTLSWAKTWQVLARLADIRQAICEDSPDSPTFAKPCCKDSPDSPTFAKGHFWEKCDSPRHIHTSNSPFSRIWGEWPLLTINTGLTVHSF